MTICKFWQQGNCRNGSTCRRQTRRFSLGGWRFEFCDLKDSCAGQRWRIAIATGLTGDSQILAASNTLVPEEVVVEEEAEEAMVTTAMTTGSAPSVEEEAAAGRSRAD